MSLGVNIGSRGRSENEIEGRIKVFAALDSILWSKNATFNLWFHMGQCHVIWIGSVTTKSVTTKWRISVSISILDHFRNERANEIHCWCTNTYPRLTVSVVLICGANFSLILNDQEISKFIGLNINSRLLSNPSYTSSWEDFRIVWNCKIDKSTSNTQKIIIIIIIYTWISWRIIMVR